MSTRKRRTAYEQRVLSRLAESIRRRREQQGWSQYDLEDRSGLDQTYISLLESGKPNPTFLVVLRLAGGLRISASKLCDGIDRT